MLAAGYLIGPPARMSVRGPEGRCASAEHASSGIPYDVTDRRSGNCLIYEQDSSTLAGGAEPVDSDTVRMRLSRILYGLHSSVMIISMLLHWGSTFF